MQQVIDVINVNGQHFLHLFNSTIINLTQSMETSIGSIGLNLSSATNSFNSNIGSFDLKLSSAITNIDNALSNIFIIATTSLCISIVNTGLTIYFAVKKIKD